MSSSTTSRPSPVDLVLERRPPLSGIGALIRLLVEQRRLDNEQGRNTAMLISGYEGSPLAGLDLELSRQKEFLAETAVVFRPGVNEELAVNAVQGSQLVSLMDDALYDGVVGIWYGKAPGLDRATDAFRHANLGGSSPSGGVLALIGDDSTAKSSSTPSSSEMALAEMCMPVLAPCDAAEILEFGLHGIAMSRFCGLWTAMKLATNVVDGATTDRSVTPVVPIIPSNIVAGVPYEHRPSATFMQPAITAMEESMVTTRLELARRYAKANALNVVEGSSDAKLGIITAGSTYLDVQQALRELGITPQTLADHGIRLLKLGMVFPLEPTVISEFTEGLDEVLVIEEKRPFIETELKAMLYGNVNAPAVFGKKAPDGTPFLRPFSDLPPGTIAQAVASRLAPRGKNANSSQIAGGTNDALPPRLSLTPVMDRTPYFCSGCPHNRSTVVPEGSLVGGGIGCSALAMLMPESRVGDITGLSQMGGEGAPWIGMAPFVRRQHLIQNLGDGTFHHSGSLAIRASVAAGTNITYKILYNNAVAMTGGQQPIGKMSVVDVVSSLRAEGVTKIVVTTDDVKKYRRSRLPREVQVRHRDRLIETQEELARIEGVTVLIHDQECATELRRKRKRGLVTEPTERVHINERVCEGCGDCGAKSNCLSVQPVETEFGRKTQIHQASCNKDLSCLDGDCPSFLTVTPGKVPAPSRSSGGPVTDLGVPETETIEGVFNIRMLGIGGTGILTTAKIVATAADLSGMHVRGLDQFGMAQKGGAVISDIRISATPFLEANKIGPDECDVYLGCDLLVAANATNLSVASRNRTRAIISTSKVPTGSMVTDPNVSFPELDTLTSTIESATRSEGSWFVDARELSQALLGSDDGSNIFMLGVAAQSGALPIAVERIEEAIERNGVAVSANLLAFRAGRQHVAGGQQPAADVQPQSQPTPETSPVAHEIAALVKCEPNSELARIVLRRVDELIKYQRPAYARKYAEHVEEVRDWEMIHAASQDVTESFARHLHKLMAYKDEYEVARLSLDPALIRELKQTYGDDVTYRFRLHPPLLRALGLKRKLSLGPSFRVVLTLLYMMRGVRGTALDPFGYAKVRVVERRLIDEYVRAMRTAMDAVTDPSGVALVNEMAALPDLVRGYEEIKLANAEIYRGRLAALVEKLPPVIVNTEDSVL